MDIKDEFEKILFENIHYPSGPVYQDINKKKAILNLEENELHGIYYLKESHAPGLRSKAVSRYIKNIAAGGNAIGLNKKHLDFNCMKTAGHDNVLEMLQQVQEMPKEWTLVQITAKSDPAECNLLVSNKTFTNDLHISVFQCGENQPKPFCISVPAPVDKITGRVMNIKGEMLSIVHDNKIMLMPRKYVYTLTEKNEYCAARMNVNNRLKNLVKDMQNFWLAEWRCLLIGKVSEQEENTLEEMLEVTLKDVDTYKITEKIKSILSCLIRSSNNLKQSEIKKVVRHCFPDDQTTVTKISKIIDDFTKEKKTFFSNLKIHPVILIVDEKLDIFPWEMMDILLNNPVSRMPSLHFTYALFKQYEHRMENGTMVGIDATKGKYIVNPNFDLNHMERRIVGFIAKRTPRWSGLIHEVPQAQDMEKCIVEGDIFSYYGHGNGSQFLASEKIQKLSIQSVVCLFGCSSSSYVKLGARVEMYGAHLMYLLGCSPCVVGALWAITDTDTDVFSTEFLNLWLPPCKIFKWNEIDKKLWEATGEIAFVTSKKGKADKDSCHEPDLLRALSKTRRYASQYITQAAFVARGLPVSVLPANKIKNE